MGKRRNTRNYFKENLNREKDKEKRNLELELNVYSEFKLFKS